MRIHDMEVHVGTGFTSHDLCRRRFPNVSRDESLFTFILLLKHCESRTDRKVQYNCLSYITALQLVSDFSSPLFINVKLLGDLFLVLFFVKQLACKTILMNPAIPGRDECKVSLRRTPLICGISATVALGSPCRIDGLGIVNELALSLIAFVVRYST